MSSNRDSFNSVCAPDCEGDVDVSGSHTPDFSAKPAATGTENDVKDNALDQHDCKRDSNLPCVSTDFHALVDHEPYDGEDCLGATRGVYTLSDLSAVELYDARKATEELGRMHTVRGKALLFVEAVLELHNSLKQALLDADESSSVSSVATDKRVCHMNMSDISILAKDDLVWLTARMFVKQDDMKAKYVDNRVDIGYHYTRPECLNRIRTDGLLTHRERTEEGIRSNYNGSRYGDGIYTCDNLTKYRNRRFGNVGILLARLKGRTTAFPEATSMTFAKGSLIVLRSSAQCVPLVEFLCEPNDWIVEYHCKLQALIDVYFNDGIVTDVVTARVRASSVLATEQDFPGPNVSRSTGRSSAERPSWLPSGIVFTKDGTDGMLSNAVHVGVEGERVCHDAIQSQEVVETTVYYEAPTNFYSDELFQNFIDLPPGQGSPTDNCVVCLSSLANGNVVRLRTCEHQYHRQCITAATMSSNRCPVCNVSIGAPVGSSPSGEMTVRLKPHLTCEGFPPGSIEIRYHIHGGTQKGYHGYVYRFGVWHFECSVISPLTACIHSNPGVRFQGTIRKAYLPGTAEGRKLLKRLEYAFSSGLTFTVGTSLTSGIANSVTWASIHHKTRTSGGPHGYPDAQYLQNCNNELDALGVPRDPTK